MRHSAPMASSVRVAQCSVVHVVLDMGLDVASAKVHPDRIIVFCVMLQAWVFQMEIPKFPQFVIKCASEWGYVKSNDFQVHYQCATAI